MLPVGDQVPVRQEGTPYITYGLIAANILVFLYQLTLSPAALQEFVTGWGVVPIEITGRVDLPPLVPVPVALTLLTSLFIHGGLLHLLSNMIFLWVFGDNVERYYGSVAFFGFYLLAGVVASMAQIATMPDSQIPMIGASGSIAGVLGAYLLLFPRATIRALFFVGPFFAIGRAGALLLIAAWFGLQLLQGVGALVDPETAGGIAFFAHIGGFLFGLGTTLLLLVLRREPVSNLREGIFLGRVARNWVIAIALFGFGLFLSSLIAQVSSSAGALFAAAVILVAATFAVYDAVQRLGGRPSFLGEGRGAGRILALIQLLAGLGLLLTLAGLA